MQSILRTLIEHHKYTLPEASSKLRQVVMAELEEIRLMGTANILLSVGSGIAIAASLTNPLGLVAGVLGLGLNVLSRREHRKDYYDIHEEFALLKAAPRVPTVLSQYAQTGMLSEDELLAAYEFIVDRFDQESGDCLFQTQCSQTGQWQDHYLHPEEVLKMQVQQIILHQDPNLQMAGIATGIEAFNERLSYIQSRHQELTRSRTMQEIASEQLQKSQSSQTQAPQIGQNTRLNALPVQASEPAEVARSTETKNNPSQREQKTEIVNWIEEIAKDPKNLFIGAKGGTGKGIFLSNYLRYRKQNQPKLRAFIIDPKCDPKERGYWNEDWIEYRGFSAISMDTEEIVHKLRELFAEYIGLMGNPNEAWLLVCDECLLVTDELSNASDRGTKRLLASQITRVISVGDSFDRNICVVSQSANAGDIGLSAGVMKTLTKIILFRDGDEETLNHLHRHGQIVVEPTKPVIKDVLQRSPRGRGAYVSNKFLPMPELPNYSGYDRDKRSVIQNEKTSPSMAEIVASRVKDSQN